MSDNTEDFLAAAQRQKKIEEQVALKGESVRAALERQSVIDQGGGAAARLLEQEAKEQQLQKVLTFAQDEIEKIITALDALPMDTDGRRFVTSRITDISMGGSVTYRCHYATVDEARDGFTFAKEDMPAFRIMFSGSTMDPKKTPDIYFYDYSRLVKDGSTYPDPTRIEAADGADLRAAVGSFVARATAQRLDEIIAAMAPAQKEPPSLSQDMTLRAPRVPNRKPKG